MRSPPHLLDDHERAEVVEICFATPGGTGGADIAINIKTGAENRRIAQPSRNLPGQPAGGGDAADFAFRVDSVAVDGVVQVLFSDQTFSQHFEPGAAAWFSSL